MYETQLHVWASVICADFKVTRTCRIKSVNYCRIRSILSNTWSWEVEPGCVRWLEIRSLSILETSPQWRRWQHVVETASFQWESNRIIMTRTRNGSLKLAVGLRHSITHKGKNHIIGPLTMNLSLILLNAALHLSARSQLHDILSFRSLCSAHHWKKMFNVEGEPNDNNIKHRLLCRATEERARLNRSFLIWKCC